MKFKTIALFLAGLFLSSLIVYAISASLYVAQGGTFHTFNYGVKVMNQRIMLFVQLGLATIVGLFFLASRKEINIYFLRGIMISVLIWVFYVLIAELK